MCESRSGCQSSMGIIGGFNGATSPIIWHTAWCPDSRAPVIHVWWRERCSPAKKMFPSGLRAGSKRAANWPGRNIASPVEDLVDQIASDVLMRRSYTFILSLSTGSLLSLYIFANQNNARLLRSLGVSGSQVVASVIHAYMSNTPGPSPPIPLDG